MIFLERARENSAGAEERLAAPSHGQRNAALRRANYAEQARPSSRNIGTPDLDEFPIARRDIKCCDKSRRRRMSYGLAFVTLMRDFITRSFLIVVLMTRPGSFMEHCARYSRFFPSIIWRCALVTRFFLFNLFYHSLRDKSTFLVNTLVINPSICARACD